MGEERTRAGRYGRGWRLLAALVLLAAAGGAAGCTGEEAPRGEPASRAVRQRLAADPRTGALLVEAQRALHEGLFGHALALVDSAERIAPHVADAPFLRGLIFTRMNRFEEAQAAYERVLALDAGYRGVRLNLGNNAYRTGKVQTALRWYADAARREPTPDVFLAMGKAYENLNRVDSARAAYGEALALDSTHALTYARLGQLYSREGAHEEAMVYARHALRLDPHNLSFRYFAASLLLQAGRPAEALGHLEEVARRRPWDEGAAYGLGQALAQLGREAEARPLLARAETLRQLSADIVELEQLTHAFADDPEQWGRLGEKLREAGRLEEALEAYKVAVHLDPENVYAQNNTASLALATGAVGEAVVRYRWILEREPGLAEVWLNLGIALVRAGRKPEAREAFERVLALRPGHPAAAAYLARLQPHMP